MLRTSQSGSPINAVAQFPIEGVAWSLDYSAMRHLGMTENATSSECSTHMPGRPVVVMMWSLESSCLLGWTTCNLMMCQMIAFWAGQCLWPHTFRHRDSGQTEQGARLSNCRLVSDLKGLITKVSLLVDGDRAQLLDLVTPSQPGDLPTFHIHKLAERSRHLIGMGWSPSSTLEMDKAPCYNLASLEWMCFRVKIGPELMDKRSKQSGLCLRAIGFSSGAKADSHGCAQQLL